MSAAKKQIRKTFNEVCLKRDGNVCRKCGGSPPLDVHHITDRSEMPNGGYVAANGISLCAACHLKAEEWHSSGKTRVEPGYSPDDLYNLIGSTLKLAIESSNAIARKNE